MRSVLCINKILNSVILSGIGRVNHVNAIQDLGYDPVHDMILILVLVMLLILVLVLVLVMIPILSSVILYITAMINNDQ